MTDYFEQRCEDWMDAIGAVNQATADVQDLVWDRTYGGDNALDDKIKAAADRRDKLLAKAEAIRLELQY